MSHRNSKTNSSPVTRPLHSARVTSKALSRSAQLKGSAQRSRSAMIPSPAKPAHGSKGAAHIVSFAEAKRSNEMGKSANAMTSQQYPSHGANGMAAFRNNASRGNHVSSDLPGDLGPQRGAHASFDLPKTNARGGKKQIKAPKEKVSDKGSKKRMKLPALPFGRKRGKEFVIPSGEDLTTESSNIFGSAFEAKSEKVVAGRSSRGVAASQSKDVAANPYMGAAASPSRGVAASSSRGVAGSLSKGLDTNPSKGVSRKVAEAKGASMQMPEASMSTSRRVSDSAAVSKAADGGQQQGDKEASKGVIAGFIESRKERSGIKKKQKAKAKADKKFDKAYGASKNAPSSDQAGPRAALYSTKMGSKHKKSAKMQIADVRDLASQSMGMIGDKVTNFKLPDLPKYATRLLTIAAVVAIFGFGLYGPAQQYYVQMRETDRLQAEFVEVAERTNNLADSIESLQTKEGIEDKAHADLGYVKMGEKSATVKGIASVNLQDLPTSNVAPGSIPAPDTWYSGALDVIFGYTG